MTARRKSRVGVVILTVVIAVFALVAVGSVGGIGPVELVLWLVLTMAAIMLVLRFSQRQPGL
jgi:fatty acid desaturase